MPKNGDKNVREQMITIRLSDKEMELLKRLAKEDRRSIAGFARNCLQDCIEGKGYRWPEDD